MTERFVKRVDARIPLDTWLELQRLLPPGGRGRGHRGGIGGLLVHLVAEALPHLQANGGDVEALRVRNDPGASDG